MTLSAERNTHVEEFAAITFEPWQGNPEIEGQSVLGKEAVERLGQNVSVAHNVMFESKEKLVEFMRDLSTAEWDYIAGCIDGAREHLQALLKIVNAADARLRVAAAVLAQDMGKDAGRDDHALSGPTGSRAGLAIDPARGSGCRPLLLTEQHGRLTVPTKQEIEAESQLDERERKLTRLREIVADLDELEVDLRKAEDAVWQPHWSRNDPLPDRLLRVGVSRTAVDKVKRRFDCMDMIRRGEPLPDEGKNILANADAAEESATQQLAAIVLRGQR